ncbi:hypothetical protein [Mycolicibacterium sp. CR10]|uniref:hypothetical protein n=1 Tax=Mycolicibacterium sp. CR10 TaxID=2562314 RepID=UPI0010C03939|nr:hypothetical protein [Mycolicibacterium sp. CR10]
MQRKTSDRFGDGVLTTVGTIDHCILDPGRPKDFGELGEFNTYAATVWIPRGSDVQAKDRLTLGGQTFRVLGTAWDHDHPATSTNFGYFAAYVEAVG